MKNKLFLIAILCLIFLLSASVMGCDISYSEEKLSEAYSDGFIDGTDEGYHDGYDDGRCHRCDTDAATG